MLKTVHAQASFGGVTALGPVRPVGLGKGFLSSAQGGPGVAS